MSTVYVLKVAYKFEICWPSLLVKYELLVVCAWQKTKNLVIELLQIFFFKTMMSAVWENTNVIQMLNVQLQM